MYGIQCRRTTESSVLPNPTYFLFHCECVFIRSTEGFIHTHAQEKERTILIVCTGETEQGDGKNTICDNKYKILISPDASYSRCAASTVYCVRRLCVVCFVQSHVDSLHKTFVHFHPYYHHLLGYVSFHSTSVPCFMSTVQHLLKVLRFKTWISHANAS